MDIWIYFVNLEAESYMFLIFHRVIILSQATFFGNKYNLLDTLLEKVYVPVVC